MNDSEHILISVQAKYVHKMLTGEKTVELRRRRLHIHPGTRVWIYTTAPSSVIEISAVIDLIVIASPEHIWRKYKASTGVCRKEFNEYFGASETGCALILKEIKKLKPHVDLADMRAASRRFHPPQFYTRLSAQSPALETLIRGSDRDWA
jgi:predicted transcriptional regulator